MEDRLTCETDTITPMSGVERAHYAVMRTVRRNFSVVTVHLRDCSRLMECIAERRTQGEKIIFTALLIRAVGLVLEKSPKLGWMRRGWKLVKPAVADVSCSVGSSSTVSPVVIIHDAGNKTLLRINEELMDLAREAKAGEAEELARMERLARLVPIGWLFRLGVFFLMTRQRFIRKKLGNFQVSVLSNSGIDFGISSMTAVTTLIVGKVKDRVIVEKGIPVVRPSAFFSLHFDHSIHGAKDSYDFMRELFRLLDNPERLL